MKRAAFVYMLLTVMAVPICSQKYLLSDLLEHAVTYDSRLQELSAVAAAARLSLSDAKGAYQPRITGGFKASYLSQIPSLDLPFPGAEPVEMGQHDNYSASVSVQQLLFSGFARSRTVSLMDTALSAARQNQTAREDELKFLVLQAAYSYLLAALSLESLEASYVRLDLSYQRVNSFRDQGLASELDVLEIEGSIHELEVRKACEEGEIERLRTSLQELTGAENIEGIIFDDAYLHIPPGVANMLSGAGFENNPGLIGLEFALESAKLQKRLETAVFFPKAYAFGGLTYGKPGISSFSDEWEFNYSGGIEVSVDIWSGGARLNALKRAGLRLEELDAKRSGLVGQLEAGKKKLLETLAALDRQYEAAVLLCTSREKKYNLKQRLWQAGQTATLEVLAAEQELTEAEMMQKQFEIRRLSVYQEVLRLLNQPVWKK
ncbi:MAG: TolC family protein [Spirochaetales bacterium]|nr:TolC family protein [Spirochaetales bacterium]